MTNTTNLNIALIAQNQAQKEITANEAISIIDAILNRGAIHRGTNTPPGSPIAGDLYIIGASPTGIWASKANNITYYNTTWKFISPNEGMKIWVNDEDTIYIWNGLSWQRQIEAVISSNSGSSYSINLDNGNLFKITLNNNCTFSFSNIPASGKAAKVTLIKMQDSTGNRSVTWPTSVKWVGGIAPTLTNSANSIDIINFLSVDGGGNWYGQIMGLDVR